MKKSLILSDEEREARNKLAEVNRLKRGKVTKRQCINWVCIICTYKQKVFKKNSICICLAALNTDLLYTNIFILFIDATTNFTSYNSKFS